MHARLPKKTARYRPPSDRTSPGMTIFLSLLCLIFAYPFAWMLVSAFKTNSEIFHPLKFWPASLNATGFKMLFSEQWFPFTRVFFNSIFIAAAQAVGAVGLSLLAGYVFARHQGRRVRIFFVLALSVIVMPPPTFAVPLFSWLHQLHLLDRSAGVILPGLVSGLGVLYFTQVFRQVPDELIDSARMEGASEFQVVRLLFPLLSSAVISFGVIHFVLAWHQHLIPLLVLNSRDQQTLPVALAALYGSSLRFPYAVLMAGSVMSILPVALFFGLAYRRFKSALADVLV